MVSTLKKAIRELTVEKSTKIDIASFFVWYHYNTFNEDVTITQINTYFSQCDLPIYNISRLKQDLRKSSNIVKGKSMSTYKPNMSYRDNLSIRFPYALPNTEEIKTDDTILPDSLVNRTRGYIINLSQQINCSYNNHIYDGCAILMRRLLEILLIHAYEATGKLNSIQEGDGYKRLSFIINLTLSTKPFSLSKEVEETIDDFRQIGNFAAHKIHYNTKKKDIDNIRLRYRLAVEELLYAAKIKQ